MFNVYREIIHHHNLMLDACQHKTTYGIRQVIHAAIQRGNKNMLFAYLYIKLCVLVCSGEREICCIPPHGKVDS